MDSDHDMFDEEPFFFVCNLSRCLSEPGTSWSTGMNKMVLSKHKPHGAGLREHLKVHHFSDSYGNRKGTKQKHKERVKRDEDYKDKDGDDLDDNEDDDSVEEVITTATNPRAPKKKKIEDHFQPVKHTRTSFIKTDRIS
jgi:hypothetical protein